MPKGKDEKLKGLFLHLEKSEIFYRDIKKSLKVQGIDDYPAWLNKLRKIMLSKAWEIDEMEIRILEGGVQVEKRQLPFEQFSELVDDWCYFVIQTNDLIKGKLR